MLNPQVPLNVHGDGKLLPDISPSSALHKVERIAVLVSGKGVLTLLVVLKILDSTGNSQAEGVCQTLQEWGIADKVKATSFDSTSSDTGRLSGACVLLENKLDKRMLHLACRHLIHELIAEKAFEAAMKIPSTGPNIKLFQRFAPAWKSIDTSGTQLKYYQVYHFSMIDSRIRKN